MSQRKKINIQTPGKQFKPLSIRGCLWCLHGERPIFHSTERITGDPSSVMYTGGICQACVKFFKAELCSLSWLKCRKNQLGLYPYCFECLLLELNNCRQACGEQLFTINSLRQLSSKDIFDLVAKFNKSHFEPAVCVDHIQPWRYFPDLFWQQENLQSLCRNCHDIKTKLERI